MQFTKNTGISTILPPPSHPLAILIGTNPAFLSLSYYIALISLFLYIPLTIFASSESIQPYFKNIPSITDSIAYDTELMVSQPYFKVREKVVDSPILFSLHPIYEKTNGEYFSSNFEESFFLDNAFHLDYTIMTQSTGGSHYRFIYDSLLRLREIYQENTIGQRILNISFSENGELVSIQETIPEELSLKILFNPNGQIAIKTISSLHHIWQYRYRYRNGRLAQMISYYNGVITSERIITWESKSEKREISRIDEFDTRGNKVHSWEIERDTTLAQGYGEDTVKHFTPYGKLIQKNLRLWNDGRITEEYVFRDKLDYRNLYRYNNYGLLKEKSTWDNNGKIIARHLYQYQFSHTLEKFIFLEQLQLNTIETTQYLLKERLFFEQKKFFHLQNLVTSSQEEIFDDQTVIQHSYIGGIDTITRKKENTVEKIVTEPLTGVTLSDRKIYYDKFGRIKEVFFIVPTHIPPSYKINLSRHPSRASRVVFFYEETKPTSIQTKNHDFSPRIEYYYLGEIYWNYLHHRQRELIDASSQPLVELFNRFSEKQEERFSESGAYLLSHLKTLQKFGLRKVIAYNRLGEVDYYYRIEQTKTNQTTQEIQFTFYPKPPSTFLTKSRIKTILPYSNSYTIPEFSSSSLTVNHADYRYLGIGGKEEFHSQTIDNIDPGTERPRETIVIRFQKTGILLNAKRIIYNPFTGKPEKETIIQGNRRHTRTLTTSK